MTLALSLESARRLAVASQHLAGPPPGGDLAGLREVLLRLRCLQLDPVNAVARSHLLVLWSRVGRYDPADLDVLLWHERWLFEYWAHAASIVLAEDYPIHHLMMRRHGTGHSGYSATVRDWMDANDALRTHILDRLREAGPLPPKAFDDLSTVPWKSTGWTNGRNVERMLDFLWGQGRILVARRHGRTRHWDLAERLLPTWTEQEPLTREEGVTRAAELALRALGVARPADIERHFTRERYPGLDEALDRLTRSGHALPAQVEGGDEPWYAHRDALDLLGDWRPRTTLLSPFDNLICDRERTQRLWGFTFRTEMYVPKHKRQYGHYVMPILHGERLIGRLVPRMDRRLEVLEIEGVFPESDLTGDIEREGLDRVAGGGDTDRATGGSVDRGASESIAHAVGEAIADLAAFAGAREVVYGEKVATPWRHHPATAQPHPPAALAAVRSAKAEEATELSS